MTNQLVQPVSLSHRDPAIDILRGFALLGIIIVNFTVDNGNVSPMEGRTGFADQVAYWTIRLFLDDKFLPIFAFLFGLGFSIQLLRATERNGSVVSSYLRRIIVLAFIGAAHIIFISGRSVLFNYALLGFVLLLFYRINLKWIIPLAILCILIPWTKNLLYDVKIQKDRQQNIKAITTIDSVILKQYTGTYRHHGDNQLRLTSEGNKFFGMGRSGKKFPLLPLSNNSFLFQEPNHKFTFEKDSSGQYTRITIVTPTETFVANRIIGLSTPIEKAKPNAPLTYWQKTERRALQFKKRITNPTWWKNFVWSYNFTGAFPLILLGFFVGRKRMLSQVQGNSAYFQKILLWSFFLGLIMVACVLAFEAVSFINSIKPARIPLIMKSVSDLLWQWGVILMAISYTTALLIRLQNINWQQKLSFLSSVGRMPLTAYILQSLATDYFFFQKFNDPEKFGPAWRTMFALISFIMIVLISKFWLKYFTMGPLEWIWRSLTYLKFQPILRNSRYGHTY